MTHNVPDRSRRRDGMGQIDTVSAYVFQLTSFNVALDTDANGQDGYTHVQSFAVAGLTLPGWSIAKVRITFEAGAAEGLTITNAYIGHAAGAGDAYDFAAAPVQLLFAGGASKAIALGATALTDWASFVYNKTSALLVAFYTAGGAGADTKRLKNAVPNTTYYYKLANDAATINKTGYNTNASLNAINKIEVSEV